MIWLALACAFGAGLYSTLLILSIRDGSTEWAVWNTVWLLLYIAGAIWLARIV